MTDERDYRPCGREQPLPPGKTEPGDDDDFDDQDTSSKLLSPNPDGVPVYLTNLPRWVLWREVSRISRKSGKTMKTKVPVGYRAGMSCDITNPLHWAGFTDVTAAMDRSTG